jgi:hypothetical protein
MIGKVEVLARGGEGVSPEIKVEKVAHMQEG